MNGLFRVVAYVACLAGLVALGRSFGSAYTDAVCKAPDASASNALLLFLFYLIVGVAFGLLIAWDTTRLIGGIVERVILEGTLTRSHPLVRQSSLCLDAGEPLESIRLLRSHLMANPDDWKIAVQIAHIYAGPLNNPTAAILEYQDILCRKLPGEVRGQILLRLFKLQWDRSPDARAMALLDQILNECPRTLAASKARHVRQRWLRMHGG